MDLIWKAVLIIVIGIMLLRFSGRKSISQMTISETVIMISIGTLLIQPIATKNVWTTFGIAAILILTLIVIEFTQLKWDATETFFTGRSKIVIENGKLNEENLHNMRLTIDQLEIRLRQNGIENIADLQWATIEPSGQLGYSFIENKKFATKEDIDVIQRTLDTLVMQLDQDVQLTRGQKNDTTNDNIFSELKDGEQNHEDDRLQ